MKKLFIAALLVACSLSSHAQFWMGGAFSIHSSTKPRYESIDLTIGNFNGNLLIQLDKMRTFGFAPEIGYDFGKWSLGIALGYQNGSADLFYRDELAQYDIEGKILSTVLIISPFMRRNALTIDRLSFFMDFGFDYAVLDNKINGSVMPAHSHGVIQTFIDSKNSSGFQVGLSPGVAFNITDKWSALFKCGFLGYSDGGYTGFNEEGFHFNLSTRQSSFGMYYRF
ncbi:MAG: outer membrane beta-barrel protein [Candidatus Limimorpha sp.]